LVADIHTALRGAEELSTASVKEITVHDASVSQMTSQFTHTNQQDSIEGVFCSTIKDSNEPAEFEAYLKRYKNGHFIDLTQVRLQSIQQYSNNTEKQSALVFEANEIDLSPVSSAHLNNAPHTLATEGIPKPLIAISIYALSTMVGVTMFFIANVINLGRFTWTPSAGAEMLDTGAKEIGFFAALNWSLPALSLMLLAWTVVFLTFA